MRRSTTAVSLADVSASLLQTLWETNSVTKDQFKEKLNARVASRLKTHSTDLLTAHGKLWFCNALAIDGYSLKIPEGENKKDYEPILSHEQYTSAEYDDVIDEVFSKLSGDL